MQLRALQLSSHQQMLRQGFCQETPLSCSRAMFAQEYQDFSGLISSSLSETVLKNIGNKFNQQLGLQYYDSHNTRN